MTGLPAPLTGITVVDLTQIYNGPYATFMMAMAGADVIKVEPKNGEHLRRRGAVGGAALPFAMLNGNKRAATLDLKSTRGRELLLEMVKRADVLVENFAPGTMDRLGLGWEVLHETNPRLIYACSSGFGRTGPNRDFPAMDLTVQAMSGIMSITGFADGPPMKAGPALCDFGSGVHLYGAIVTALYEREKTNTGRFVEVAMQEAVYSSLASNLGLYFGSGAAAVARTGNRHGGMAESPYNVYKTRDGYIAIICVGEAHWVSLVEAMERPDLAGDPRFANLQSRVTHIDEVDAIVGEWTASRDKNKIFELLMRHHVPSAPVRELDEVVNDAHMHERGALTWIDHPELGRIVVQRSPMRYEGTDLTELTPSARLGAHNDSIFGEWLGLSGPEISDLRAGGII